MRAGRLGLIARSAALGTLALTGVAVGFGAAANVSDTAGQRVTSRMCRVTDGDTLRCGGERIRLLGIDAPELAGHCRPGRDCVPGDAAASTESLRRALTGELRIERMGRDHYGRTLALIEGRNGDLSCWQLSHGQAIYKPRWDEGGRVARRCPESL